MPQTATIKSLPVAFAMLKAMQAEGVECCEDYRAAARHALAQLLEGRMAETIDRHLERMANAATPTDATALRTLAAHRARPDRAARAAHPDLQRAQGGPGLRAARPGRRSDDPRLLRARALDPQGGQEPGDRERRGQAADAVVAAFHRRPLKDQYRVLVLDGVVLKRKTGAGALARPVLVALGLRPPDGKKEVIDFRLATAECAAQWERAWLPAPTSVVRAEQRAWAISCAAA
jgi:hypothetical protein